MANNNNTTTTTTATATNNNTDNRPWYQKGALPLGSCIGGIPIYLHWSFFALLAIMLLSSLLAHATDPQYYALIALEYGPILLVTILIHEFGHAFMTKHLGGQVGDMVLWPLGGFVICGPTETVLGDFKVAIAGPLTHLPQMAVWIALYAGLEGGDFEFFNMDYNKDDDVSFGGRVAAQAFYLNVVLMIFNLFVPAYPLDGGRCLAAALVMCGVSVMNAAITTAVVGMVIAALIGIYGIASFFTGNSGGIFMFAMAAWIFMSSYKMFKLNRPASGMYGTPMDQLKQHPVFGQDCYQNRGNQELAQQQANANANNV